MAKAYGNRTYAPKADLRAFGIHTPENYGAVGNGIANDSVAVQAAIDAGGSVLLPSAVYIANVNIKAGVNLSGTGFWSDTVLKSAAGSNKAVISVPSFATLVGSSSNGGEKNFAIRNLTVDGNKANNTSGRGVELYGANYLVENVIIRNCAGDGFFSEWGPGGVDFDGMEAMVRKVHIHDNGGDGFIHAGPHDSQHYDIMTWYNGVGGAGGVGFNVQARSAGTLWTNCHAYGPHSVSWLMNGQGILNGCIGEGGAIQLHIRTADVLVTGGSYFASGNIVGQVGVKIGDTGVPVTGARVDTRVNGCEGGSLVITNSNGANDIKIRAYQAAGSYMTGTPNFADRIMMQSTGQSRAVSTLASYNQWFGKTVIDTGAQNQAFIIQNAGVDIVSVNASAKRIELPGGASIRAFSDSYSTQTFNLVGASGHLNLKGGAPTIIAGSATGGTPPAPVATNCSDSKGSISFGTGSGAIAGELVRVTYGANFSDTGGTPAVSVTPLNAATAALGLYVTKNGSTAFSLNAANVPAVSAANTTYAFDYHVLG
jgi:hypothetical protein